MRLVTLLGKPLSSVSFSRHWGNFTGSLLYGVNTLKPGMAKKTETSKPKEGMKHINHVARSVGNATLLTVLMTISLPRDDCHSTYLTL